MDRGRQRALFLHGGPGLNSAVEREWFGEELPIDWWDQPTVGDAAQPFAALLDAAAARLHELAQSAPIHIVAHSFAGQLAYGLARDYPQLIERITLLGSSPEAMAALLRVFRRIAETDNSAPVHNALAAVAQAPGAATLTDLIAAVAASPSYPSLYFAPNSPVYGRFVELLGTVGNLDLPTLIGVMAEFFGTVPLAPLPQYTGAVELVTGRNDPTYDETRYIAEWRRIFPQLTTTATDSGHFIHLEVPPTVWFGTGNASVKAPGN